MKTSPPTSTILPKPASWARSPSRSALTTSRRRSLATRRASPRTVATYTIAVAQLAAYLAAPGMPTRVSGIPREHVEAWVTDLLARPASATANGRWRGAQAFFGWCVEEGEIRECPMARMKPPALPEAPLPVQRDAHLLVILAACERDRTLLGRRDEAILRVFMDAGAGRAEVLGLRPEDVKPRSRDPFRGW